MIEVVKVESNARVCVGGTIRHLCPFVPETDTGLFEVTWLTDAETLELHSLAAYVTEWADVVISHEDLTTRMFKELSELVPVMTVETTWTTAGQTVTVTRSAEWA